MHFLFVSSINAYKCHIIIKLFINLTCLVLTEKYRTLVFLYKPRPTDSVCTKKTSVRYFSVKTSHKKLIFLKYGWPWRSAYEVLQTWNVRFLWTNAWQLIFYQNKWKEQNGQLLSISKQQWHTIIAYLL
jgi:hypothetical protein